MALTRFYGYRDKVLIPVVMQAEEGFYFDAAPVDLYDSADSTVLRTALNAAMKRTNDVVPTPQRLDEHDPGSPLLEALHLRKWQQFEAEAAMYSVYINEDSIDYYASGNAFEGSWITQRMRRQSFELRCAANGELVDKLLADIVSDQQDRRPKSGSITLLLPPPAGS
jgi:hypothetical protein